jgi:hypothetical protein
MSTKVEVVVVASVTGLSLFHRLRIVWQLRIGLGYTSLVVIL